MLLVIFVLGACEKKERASGIFVEKIEAMPTDFLKGVDVSSALSLENSGVTFYDFEGKKEDLFVVLADAGVNAVRLRVWNDPYDASGNGYGGGNNDLETAVVLGKRATKQEMKVLIDFHYSDFWADPLKQQAPKAWKDMDLVAKESAVYEYTKASMETLLNEKVDVHMVQIGNETTNGFCGESNWKNIATLMNAAAKAIREVSTEQDKEILIGIHFTNPEKQDSYDRFAKILDNFKVDYDVFISSYYPYWHGSLENLSKVLSDIAKNYGKLVMVGEVSYAYSYENYDQHINTITRESVFEKVEPLTVQGQANVIRDVMATVASIEGGIGLFYWEPAWIPVPAEDFEEQSALWERFGSGWASSYAAEYDPEDAGVWYGGSSWDNQALFDSAGKPLPSLDVFRLVEQGAATTIRIDEIKSTEVRIRKGDELTLPAMVISLYNNKEEKEVPVTWQDYDEKIAQTAGIYQIQGAVKYSELPVYCTVKVLEPNYIENPGFEEEDTSMWSLTNEVTTESGVLEKATDAHTDFHSWHFYSSDRVDFVLEQEVKDLKPGRYNLSVFIQGGDVKNEEMYLYAVVDGERYEVPMTVEGWNKWQNPTIEGIDIQDTVTIGVTIKSDKGAWGSLDDFSLYPIED